jgi:methylmalonyl-CoA mutase, N-terminal domain
VQTADGPASERTKPDAPIDEWRARVGALPDASTDSGLDVAPLYTPRDAPEETYAERLGVPGQYPFTRGIYAAMYRQRLWTMRLYSGWGGPEDTNERFRYLLREGQTGLSVALDLPTQMGMNSDHTLAEGEVGKVGVAIDSLADMEAIFDGFERPVVRSSRAWTGVTAWTRTIEGYVRAERDGRENQGAYASLAGAEECSSARGAADTP